MATIRGTKLEIEIDKKYIAAVICLLSVKPREAFIAITYACNAKCVMCNIWQNQSRDEMAIEHYAKVPRTLKTINITGGEPFLRKDIVQLVKTIDSAVPDARLVFSTNGSMTDVILSRLAEIRSFHDNIGVGVSIDGLELVHDRIRGVTGFFGRALSTVEKLKGQGYEDLRIAMTLVDQNANQVKEVYDLSKRLGVEFTLTAAHDSELYFQKTDNTSVDFLLESSPRLAEVMLCQLRSGSPKDWFRAYHTMGIMDSSVRRRFASECEAGCNYFFMSPSGDVYPCNVMNLKIGNISKVARWDDLFTEEAEMRMRGEVQECRKNCWMICNTKSLMRAHPVRVGTWILSHKIPAHLKHAH